MQKRRSFLGSLLALFAPVPAVPGPLKRYGAVGPVAPSAIGVELPPRAMLDWYGTYGGSFGQLYAVQASQSILTEYALTLGIAQGLAGVPAWVAGGAGLDVPDQDDALRAHARGEGDAAQGPLCGGPCALSRRPRISDSVW